jgi:hypothetical protein
VVLSPEFVRKKHPMRELRIFLDRTADLSDRIVIIPDLVGLTYTQCTTLENVYEAESWPESVSQVEDKGVLKGWAADVKALLDITGATLKAVRALCLKWLMNVPPHRWQA